MSKYAVIEVGSRQEKVVEGDILEVPKSFSLESMNPILLSPRKGSIVTDKKKFISMLSWFRTNRWEEIKEN